MRDQWTDRFSETARAYWTEARLAELTRGKRLAILPHEAPMLLRALGLLHRDATMPPTQMRKFLQINHVVRMLEPAFDALRALDRPLTIVDAGCGRSYLSLLIAHVARSWSTPVRMIGVDRNAEVIEECKRRAELAEIDTIAFVAQPLEAFDSPTDAVLALHACDTATDDAIVLGVRARASLIAVAPCCQAELARAWSEAPGTDGFAPIRAAPHLRREIAAHVTDAMRVLLLRAAGYRASAGEFIPLEHSAKNTLIRANRDVASSEGDALAEYASLVAATGGAGIALAARLQTLRP